MYNSIINVITPISRIVSWCCQNTSESLHRAESVWRGSVMTLDTEAVKTKTSISNISSPRALQWYNGKQILRTQESDPMEQQGVQKSVFMLLPFWVGRGKVNGFYIFSPRYSRWVSQTLLPTAADNGSIKCGLCLSPSHNLTTTNKDCLCDAGPKSEYCEHDINIKIQRDIFILNINSLPPWSICLHF